MAKKKRLYALYYEKAKDKNSGKYLKNLHGGKIHFTSNEKAAMIFDNAFLSNKLMNRWNGENVCWFTILVTGKDNKFIHLMGAKPQKPKNLITKKIWKQLSLFED